MTLLISLLALAALAQSNRIYIDDFEIYPDSTITVPLVLANESRTRGFQFDLIMPQGLIVEEYKLNDYSTSHTMYISFRTVEANHFFVMIYPSARTTYPVDTTEVMTFTFAAQGGFKGGEIYLTTVRGSTINNTAFVMEGDTVNVTVPTTSLIGIPMDNHPVKDEYFNLQGIPIPSPDSVPVAICVTTQSDGRTNSRKVAVRP